MKKFKLNSNKGITLIALVITIIVLLILAAVSIATLTGENGILTQATKAREKNNEAEVEERVKLEVMASYDDNGKFSMDKLKDNIKNHLGVEDITDTGDGENRKLEFELDGYKVEVDSKGTVTLKEEGQTPPPPPKEEAPTTVEEAISKGYVFKKEDNRQITDSYGNSLIVPEGFKIADDSGENVTKGIVIEDVENEKTKGSQFVWIPVGKVYKNENEYEEITLGRYVFKADGSIDTQLSVTEPTDQLKTVSPDDEYYYTEGLKNDSTTNTHAKDIEGFITSVGNSGGYYIGRYEARNGSEETARNAKTDPLTQITENPNHNIYNYVKQSQAATLSQGMYEKENGRTFESDLMNSYAWDTAVLFVQKFDDRENKTTPYSRQSSLNTNENGELASKGTNNTETPDEICNIWDMASNCYEWTTETCSVADYPCTDRGGRYYYSGYYTSSRNNFITASSSSSYSFRPLLIM